MQGQGLAQSNDYPRSNSGQTSRNLVFDHTVSGCPGRDGVSHPVLPEAT